MKRDINRLFDKMKILAVSITVSCIFIYVGHFLFWEKNTGSAGDSETGREAAHEETGGQAEEETGAQPDEGQGQKQFKKSPLEHNQIIREINGLRQVINLLEVDIAEGRAVIKPELSFGLIYGFEKQSAIFERTGAAASINGGFFYEYGEPSGMVMKDGILYTKPTGKFPVFISTGNTARFEEINMELEIRVEDKKITVDDINVRGKKGMTIIYTPHYGTTNRSVLRSLTYIIRKGKVEKAVETREAVKIPEDGMLLTYYYPYHENRPFPDKGESVSFSYNPDFPEDTQAYECGSWLVKDGEILIGAKDPWVGVMTNHDPRTAIGIKNDGKIVLLTVDGRQTGYSSGFTGRELAEFLLECGITHAAMLDGGATTQMIYKGEIVNKPSYRGLERKIAGALVVKQQLK